MLEFTYTKMQCSAVNETIVHLHATNHVRQQFLEYPRHLHIRKNLHNNFVIPCNTLTILIYLSHIIIVVVVMHFSYYLTFFVANSRNNGCDVKGYTTLAYTPKLCRYKASPYMSPNSGVYVILYVARELYINLLRSNVSTHRVMCDKLYVSC